MSLVRTQPQLMRQTAARAPGWLASAMPRLIAPVLMILALTMLAPGLTRAQGDPDQSGRASIADQLTQVEANLDQIAQTLKRPELTDEELAALRARLAPLRVTVETALAALASEHAAARSRLDQLGPAPEEGAPPEAPALAAQRAALQQGFDSVDSMLRRANVARLGATQLADVIAERRRQLLQAELSQRSSSILNPLLWRDVVREAPATWRAIGLLASDWSSNAVNRLAGVWAPFLALLASLALATVIVWRLVGRFLRHPDRSLEASDYHKARQALLVTLALFAAPSIAIVAMLELLRAFDLLSPRVAPLFVAVQQAVMAIALTAGLTRGVLAPRKPGWRLVAMENGRARRFTRLAVSVVSIAAGVEVVQVLLAAVAAPVSLSQVLRAVGALAIVIIAGRALYVNFLEEARFSEEVGPVIATHHSLEPLWRMLIWISIALVIGATVFGFFNLAEFVVRQAIWIAIVAVAAWLLLALAESGLAEAFGPHGLLGRLAVTALGLRSGSLGQVTILVVGLVKLTIYAAAFISILAPFGVGAQALVETFNAAFFGFSIGGIRISFATIVSAIGVFAVAFLITRAFQRWLEGRLLPSTSLDRGLQNSISTSAGYVGVIAAIAFALAYLGLNFERLALIAGALSLGIGFGLQSIVNNFVSGLILLWERRIGVGDWIVVGAEQGYVRRITVRSTEIETFDRQMVVVPNSDLISGVVKNWVSNDKTGRITLPVRVSYNSDVEQVREILLASAKNHGLIMDDPAPQVLFHGFGDSSLDFELRCFLSDINSLLTVRSHLYFEIFRRFKQAGIEIPFPQRDINLRDIDRIEALFRNRSGEAG